MVNLSTVAIVPQLRNTDCGGKDAVQYPAAAEVGGPLDEKPDF